LDATLRGRDPDTQRETLGSALDLLDALAAERKVRFGIILDEFQEIHRLDGENAEWHFRGVIERHAHVTYLLAGSRTALIHRMVSDPGRALFKLMAVGDEGVIPVVPIYEEDRTVGHPSLLPQNKNPGVWPKPDPGGINPGSP
jgi:hypothetical protein